jgi:hypothetical protein
LISDMTQSRPDPAKRYNPFNLPPSTPGSSTWSATASSMGWNTSTIEQAGA